MRRFALAALLVVAPALVRAQSAEPAPPAKPVEAAPAEPVEAPKDLGLAEAVTTRLVQVDVSVSGPEAALAALRDQDFTLWIEGKQIERFSVDRTCGAPAAGEEPAPGTMATSTAAPRARPTTYVLYFDNGHLTNYGRHRSIDIARQLIPMLLVGGARATLVSNALALETVVPLTASRDLLLQGLAKMENDKTLKYYESYSALEEIRVNEVVGLIRRGEINGAYAMARGYQMEERWRQERDLGRLTSILGRFAEIDPPKATIYFADTMRRNAGWHYFDFFPDKFLYSGGANDALTGALPVDRVISEASSFGIRFYAIEGQGLTGGQGTSSRVRDAQSTLVGLALETGGRAFLNVSAPKIAQRILADLSCMFLLSFDPRGLRQDAPLRVTVDVKDPRLKVQTRGRLVVQSESSRLTSKLLANFAAPEVQTGDVPLRVGIMPAGFANGRYKARVQIAVPGTPVIGATWDLGVSLVSRGEVRDDDATRIRTTSPNTPAVFETEMDFRPGPYELVAVAHDATGDQIANRRIEGSFPDPDAALAMIGPIAVVQRVNGAFVRDGTVRTSGNLVTGDAEPLRADLPTAVLLLVCRAKDEKGTLEVQRSLIGETTVAFPRQPLERGAERCVQILDVIPQGALGPGKFHYIVRVVGSVGEIAKAERVFIAAAVPPPAL